MHVNQQPPPYSVACSSSELSLAASDSAAPPAYSPPYNQPSPAGDSFNVSSPPYDAYSNYQYVPPAFGHAQPTAPPPQLQTYQNVHFNVTGSIVSQPSVIVTQPASVVRSPPTYLGWSIFNFLCCFWPLGLAAIIYSVKVGGAHNHQEAKRHSLTARNLNIAATTIAPILVIVIVGATVGSAATRTAASSSRYTPSAGPIAYYYTYSYYYYYAYFMYYYEYGYNSTRVYARLGDTYYYYWYTVYGYRYAIASKYVLGSTYQYAQGVSYYYG